MTKQGSPPFMCEDRQGSFGKTPELPWRSRHFFGSEHSLYEKRSQRRLFWDMGEVRIFMFFLNLNDWNMTLIWWYRQHLVLYGWYIIDVVPMYQWHIRFMIYDLVYCFSMSQRGCNHLKKVLISNFPQFWPRRLVIRFHFFNIKKVHIILQGTQGFEALGPKCSF